MSIEIRITGETAADVRKQMSELLGSAALVATQAFINPEAPQTRARPPKAEPASAAATVEAPVAESASADGTDAGTSGTGDTTTDDGEPGALTYDGDIKPAVIKLSQKGGRPAVEKLLAGFNVGNAKDVPEAKWGDLLAAIDAAMEG